MGSLEKTLEEDVARRRREALEEDRDFTAEALHPEDDKELQDLEPTPLSTVDTVYEEDGDDANDDLLDLGVQLGKVRITERIGGFARPKFGEEIANTLYDPHWLAGAQPQERIAHQSDASQELGVCFQGPSYIGPSPEYIAPSSSFFFAPEPTRSSLIDFLPSKAAADKLLGHYWLAAHTIARIVHKPSFERQYERFWHDVSMGLEPPHSLQAVILGMLFTSVVSMTDEQVMQEFGCQKSSLVETFRLGTEMALGKANFLRTTRLETIQAFVMYLSVLTIQIPLCRAEVSRAHSALTGTAIRLAECMGLHRDGSYYGLSAVETHVRRLIWFQLCYLDIRTCEASGPRPQIRSRQEGGFDAKFPLNIDEEELLLPNPPTEDAPRFTNMTLAIIRMKVNEIQRLIWEERPKVEQQKTSITAVLGKLQRARLEMDAKFIPLIDERIPAQLLAKHVYHITADRWHISFLHRYHNSVAHRMPDRLRQLILTYGTTQMEHSIALETHPSLAPWRWYAGALQQYHTALLLLSEIYAYPMRKEADRIWKCLDYVFDIPQGLNRDQKAKLVFGEVAARMKAYHSLRKTRAPAVMERMVGIRPPRKIGDGHRVEQPTNTAVHMPPQTVSQMQIPPHERGSSDIAGPHGPSPPPPPVSAEYNFNAAPGVNVMSGAMGATNTSTLEQMYAQDPTGGWSPLPPSNSSDSGSMGSGMPNPAPNDLQAVMDIDWNEFELYFPPDQFSGELNVPNWTYGSTIPMSNMDPNAQ
ncbi:MAG: hypothetical protein Q9165_002359 [Trypethelium subeluteriae]